MLVETRTLKFFKWLLRRGSGHATDTCDDGALSSSRPRVGVRVNFVHLAPPPTCAVVMCCHSFGHQSFVWRHQDSQSSASSWCALQMFSRSCRSAVTMGVQSVNGGCSSWASNVSCAMELAGALAGSFCGGRVSLLAKLFPPSSCVCAWFDQFGKQAAGKFFSACLCQQHDKRRSVKLSGVTHRSPRPFLATHGSFFFW